MVTSGGRSHDENKGAAGEDLLAQSKVSQGGPDESNVGEERGGEAGGHGVAGWKVPRGEVIARNGSQSARERRRGRWQLLVFCSSERTEVHANKVEIVLRFV